VSAGFELRSQTLVRSSPFGLMRGPLSGAKKCARQHEMTGDSSRASAPWLPQVMRVPACQRYMSGVVARTWLLTSSARIKVHHVVH
jgi:hypothetical protein